MAITKTIDIDVNSSNAEKNISKLNGNLNNLTDATVKVKDASKEFGLISEGTSQTLDKVQSGVETAVTTYKSFSGALKSFGIIQKITTAAQYVWNAAMAANPIGAVVAVVVALVAAGYALVRMFQASSEAANASATANKKLNQELKNEIESQKKATIESDLQRDSQLKMAKASGASGKEIRKLSEELANQEVKQKIANAETLKAIFLEARRKASLKDSTDAQKETAKAAFKDLQDANKLAEDAVSNRRKLAIDNRVAERQEQTDANNKTKESNKKNNDELLEQQKKLKEDAKKINEDALANNLKSSQTELEQLEADYKAKKALLVAQSISTEALEIEFLNKKNDINLANQKIDYDVKQKAKEDNKVLNAEKIAQEDAQFLKLQEITLAKDDFEKLQLVQKYEAELILAKGNAELQLALKDKLTTDIKAIDDKSVEEQKANEQALFNAKLDFAGQGLALVSEIAGKGSKIGKAIAIAETIRSGIQGVQNAYTTAQKSPITIGFPAYPFVQAGLAGAFSALQLAKIKSSSDTGGSAPSGGGGGGGGGTATATPQFNIVGQSSTNQLAQTISSQQKQPIKTYVVAGDVTTQQSLDRNAVQTSTFGG